MSSPIQTIKDLLSRKKVRDFEIYLKRERGTNIEVREQKLSSLENQDSLGFGIRLFNQGRVGFAYGTDLSESSLAILIDRALESSKYTPTDSAVSRKGGMPSLPTFSSFDKNFSSLSFDRKIEMAKTMEKEALAFDPRIKRVRYASYSDSAEEVFLFDTNGFDASYQKTHFSLTLMAVAEKGDDSESAYEYSFSPYLADLNPDEIGRNTSEQALALLGGKKIKSLLGPVVINRHVASEILELLGPSATVENIQKKNSYLVGKLGQKIYSDAITLIDDGLYPKGEASQPFDDEGTPCQSTCVVEGGIVRQFLADRLWGERAGVRPTGNSFRESALSSPALGLSNFYLKPGSLSKEALLQKMGNGLLITDAIGMHTADPISGDFSVGVQGFVVTNGQIGQPFRSVAFTGNLHELLNKTVAVGADLRFFGSIGSSSLLIEDASISGD